MSAQGSQPLHGLVLPIADWPVAERAAWTQAIDGARSPFRKNGGGRTRSPLTFRNYARGYGRWLAHLRDIGALDLGCTPKDRVTPERLDAYLAALRAHGNADQTLVNRLSELSAALGLLHPGVDFRWVRHPQGVHIRQHLPMQRREKSVHHGATLLDWAQQLFAAGMAHHKPRCRRALIRDAVIIGILVLPAPRLGALSQLRLGRNIQRQQQGWMLDQDAGITKMGRGEWCPLHEAVTPMLDRYLMVERVELLGGHVTDRLWVAQGGHPLAEASVSRHVRKHSGRDFGKAFGPHAFRHSLGTTNAIDNFAAPLDASVLLGHTNPSVTSRYYNLAKGSEAARRQADRLRRYRG